MSMTNSTSRQQEASSSPRRTAETPPPHYWQRWASDDAGEVTASAAAETSPVPESGTTGTDEPQGEGGSESPYRVLIVEDDRGQALFAQSVLHGAGMHADVQMQPDGVLDAIRRFNPDLILMDLHMPGQDGMTLTMLIRQQPEYLHLPIVFLTGDPDPERQFEVLESGADDFLNKPIRPRHLIAAVSNRIQRARQRAQSSVPRHALNSETGLPTRAYVLQLLSMALQQQATGALYFIEIAGGLSLRERYGYAVFEKLMLEAGRQLAEAAAPYPLARLNDNSFLALARGLHEDSLGTYARTLHDRLAAHTFTARENETLNLRCSVGYASLAEGFTDTGSALEATERAVLQARLRPDSVSAYAPAKSDPEEPGLVLDDAKFELAYQPIVSVAGSEQAQYQVLLRMREADGSLLPASRVIPVAESTGGIAQIDHWVMEHAIYLLSQRQQSGPSLRLFVSQSARTLAREAHATWLLDTLARHNIESTSLVIDLRLADALIHTVTLRQFCNQLMQAGVQFCLSQFEPGNEADALLSLLPLSYLRVASRFADTHAHPALRDELRGVIDQAHRLGLQVIGQQIEDPQAAAAMWMGGIDFIQGNLVQAVGNELGFDFHSAVL